MYVRIFKSPSTHFASLAVRWRNMTLEPNVRQSISSVAVAYTRPAFTMDAHWASASQGAYERWGV